MNYYIITISFSLFLFILYQVWCQDLHNTANKHKEWYCQGSRCFRHLSEINKALFSKGGQTLARVAQRSCKDHPWRYSKAHSSGQPSLTVLLEQGCWTRQPPAALSSLKYFLIYSLPSPLYSLYIQIWRERYSNLKRKVLRLYLFM